MRAIRRLRFVSLLCLGLTASAADLNEGIAAFNAGRYTEALRLLEPARADGDQRAAVYLALTKAALNQCDAAMATVTAPVDDRDLARLAGLAATRCYSTSGSTPKALSVIESLKARYPEDADVLYVAAETEMKAFNDTTFALFQHDAASYRVHELSARIFEVQNRFSDAVAEYRKAIEISPQAPDLHFRLGRAMMLENHSPESLKAAAEAFSQELKISPEDGACEFQLGQIAQVRSEPSEARQHFERALQLSPEFVAAMVALANVYSHEKQYDRAILLLQRAVRLQPANESAHYALLTAYRNSGQMENARAEKETLDRLQKPPEGEFSDFLKKLGDKPPAQ